MLIHNGISSSTSKFGVLGSRTAVLELQAALPGTAAAAVSALSGLPAATTATGEGLGQPIDMTDAERLKRLSHLLHRRNELRAQLVQVRNDLHSLDEKQRAVMTRLKAAEQAIDAECADHQPHVHPFTARTLEGGERVYTPAQRPLVSQPRFNGKEL